MSGAFDYSRAKATADRLLARFGKRTAAYLVKPGAPSGPSYDPTPGAPTAYPVSAVVTSYDVREVDGARVRAEDRRVYVSVGGNAGLRPDASWSLRLASNPDRDFPLVSVSPLEPGDVTLLWEVQCRMA